MSKGRRHGATEPAKKVVVGPWLLTGGWPVTGEHLLAVRSFSEAAIHVTLVAQSIIRLIYPRPCDLSLAFLCLVSSKNK
jgi:hypothetical protein